jgi:hypothetical protein
MKWPSTLQIMIYQTNTQHNKEMGFILNFIYSHLCSYMLRSFTGKKCASAKGQVGEMAWHLANYGVSEKHTTQ